jgi:hypothetical protein
MDKNQYTLIIRDVCEQLKIHNPDDTIVRNIMSFIKSRNLKSLRLKYPKNEDFNEELVSMYLHQYQDKHEDTFNIDDIARNEYKTDLIKDNILASPYHTTQIFIDSINRNAINYNGQDINKFEFEIVPLTTSNETRPGSIISYSNLINITSFEVGKIILPYNSNLGALNFSQEITLSFTNIVGNSVHTANESFHFKFNYTVAPYNNNLIILEPFNVLKPVFTFNPPLRTLDRLSIQFNDPYYPISFNVDRMTPSSFDYSNSAGLIHFPKPHNLITNDIIIIKGLTTNSNNDFNILQQINNPKGVKVTVVDSYSITISIDFTTIVAPDVSSLPLIIFYSKTFRFPLIINYTSNEKM